ncbi:hypothetical protein LV85_04183 [Algoriphagus chordae]|uniref:Uncharacterized protein n=1 Tax=Algoriphagus chordae TaxID=237019 RepID=A0A2W7QYK7_9BACT|nr:hypothetical protein LV85_04183 [Algoriphagus chordae]
MRLVCPQMTATAGMGKEKSGKLRRGDDNPNVMLAGQKVHIVKFDCN